MEGDINLYGNDGAIMLASYHFIRDKKKKKLHLQLRKEYFLGLPDALQSFRHQTLYRSPLLMLYLPPLQKIVLVWFLYGLELEGPYGFLAWALEFDSFVEAIA
eukprot:15366616-Ditylum_brightwellii.AAC.2